MRQSDIMKISQKIIGCAIEVQKQMGPGLLESVYHFCMIEEMQRNGLRVESYKSIPLSYKGQPLSKVLTLDLLVDDLIVVELKAVEAIHPVYSAQLLSYLKLAKKPKGLLINFHTVNVTKGIISMVTEEFMKLPE